MHDAAAAAEHLEATYRLIQKTRMQDVPILNPALSVQAVGIRSWQGGGWFGALVTPWSINLMIFGAGRDGTALKTGTAVGHAFPAGRIEFLAGEEEGFGAYQMCSLFSPVLEFADQETAVEAAEAALAALFEEEMAEAPSHDAEYLNGLARGTLTAEQTEEIKARVEDDDAPRKRQKERVSRRELLSGALQDSEAGPS